MSCLSAFDSTRPAGRGGGGGKRVAEAHQAGLPV